MQFLLPMGLGHKEFFKKIHINICPCAHTAAHLIAQYHLSDCPEQVFLPFLLGFSSVKPSSNTTMSFLLLCSCAIIFPDTVCQSLTGFPFVSHRAMRHVSSQRSGGTIPPSSLLIYLWQNPKSVISMSLVPLGAKEENLRDMYLCKL